MNKVIKAPRLSEQDYLVPVCSETDASQLEEAAVGAAETASSAEIREDAIRQEILNNAFAEGRKAGRTEAEKNYDKKIEIMQTLLEEIGEEVEAFYTRMETRTVDVAVAMVKKVVGTTSEIQPDLFRQSVRKVLARHNSPGEMLTLHLHPDDFHRMAPDESVAPKNLKMIADPSLMRGGCMLETNYGLIDARLETQLEELEKILRECTTAQCPPSQVNDTLERANEIRAEGRVMNIVGTVIESRGPSVSVGEQCEIFDKNRESAIHAEVIGFKDNKVLLMPLEDAHGIGPGQRVISKGNRFTVQAGDQLLGRVINALGQPIDGIGPISGGESVSIHGRPNNPMQRRSINAPLYTGIRAIDGLLTCAKGGRMGIFAGSGVGKSVLLGMMARNTQADINVIALIGERGREVREFVERDLGEEGRKRSVIIAVTSDESPVLRIHGAKLAASVAEYFARQGKDVMFMMDSVTRFAMAQREIGLAIGEPPTTKGYTPSTFAALPKLLERSGVFGERGSITGFYTVLVEGDDMDEPVSDHVRSILDGHIVLSRALFSQNHFPAIDVLSSISRLSKQVCTAEQNDRVAMLRNNLAIYQEAQDLVNIGAYVKGSNPKIDIALRVIGDIKGFLRQGIEEKVSPDRIWEQLGRIVESVKTS